jgi:hypothetical protein
MGNARPVCRIGLLFALLLVCGCGDGTAKVSGTVTLDGTPLEQGSISFLPINGNVKTTGGEIKAGQYVVQVPLGPMKVCINSGKAVGKIKLYDTPNSRERTRFVELLPAKYSDIEQTELRLEIPPGDTVKDFDLTTK